MSLQVYLQTPADRARAVDLVRRATKGLVIEIREPKKTSRQNRLLHALLTRISEAGVTWASRLWSPTEWKAILISGFLEDSRGEDDELPMITGLEGEVVQIRRSWSSFGRAEGALFLTYVIAFCAARGIDTEEPT